MYYRHNPPAQQPLAAETEPPLKPGGSQEHCQRAHLHVPASPVTTPVDSGRRGRPYQVKSAPSPHWRPRRHSFNGLAVRWISRVGQNAVRRDFKRVEAMSSLSDLAINLLASVIAGLAVFTAQRAQRRRVLGKRRRFFGAYPDRTCMICAPRWAGSTTPASVSRFDVVALIEVATIIKECGSSVELASQSDQALLQNSLGDRPEFCIGGPEANTRMSAHLQTFLPQVKYDKYAEVGAAVTLHIGNSSFVRRPGEVELRTLRKDHI